MVELLSLLSSDHAMLCKMSDYVPLTWFWGRRWLCVGWKLKKRHRKWKIWWLKLWLINESYHVWVIYHSKAYTLNWHLLEQNSMIHHMVALESQSKKNLKNRSVAPPRGRIWIIFCQYINDVISLPTMTSFFDES